VRALIRDGIVTAVHDTSDGGLLVALAEMAMVSHIGAVLEAARWRCFAYFVEDRRAHTHRTGNPVLLPGLSYVGVPCVS
jgi:phosphoribosylformylglycinamidine (FGAM) synthase-like enzyme